jgi:hypothetical protein
VTPRTTVRGRGLPVLPAFAAARVVSGALAAAVGAVLLAGCQVASPIQTSVPYNAGDGVPVDLGDVQIRNLVVVADTKGGPGTLSGSLINTAGTAQTVTFSDGQSQVEAQARPHSQAPISDTAQVVLPSVNATPGGVVRLSVATPASGASVVVVPVLAADLYYKTLAPSAGSTTSATPTESTAESPAATASSSSSG